MSKGIYHPKSPYTPQECEAILIAMEALLDGTATEEQRIFIEKKLEECPYCFEQWQIEKTLRQLLKDYRNKVRVPSALKKAILERIQIECRKEDLENSTKD